MLNTKPDRDSCNQDSKDVDKQPSRNSPRIDRWIDELSDWAERSDVAYLATLSPSKRVKGREAVDAHTAFVKFLRKELPRAFRKGLVGATVRETTTSGPFAGMPHFHTLIAARNRSGQHIEEELLYRLVKRAAKRLRTPVKGAPVFEKECAHLTAIFDRHGLCKYLSKDLKSRGMRNKLEICFFNHSVTADFVKVSEAI